MSSLKVALVHDWLTGMRGGEYVLEAIAELFPRSDLFTLLYVPGKISPTLTTLRRHTSWLQKVPGAEKRYRSFLPVMPSLAERFDLEGFDLVISSSHCVAKGVRKPPGAVHVSYIHAPMRYMWDRFGDYFGPGKASPHVRFAARVLRPRFQKWDRESSTPDRVDLLIANSRFIAGQIRAAYGRDAKVIYPFANLDRFTQARRPGRNYLIVGAFAPNKRVDIAIEAFNRMQLPLLIVGSGQEEGRLKKLAGPTVDFMGPLSNAAIDDLYSKCRAFVFPGVEDFGITPLEAMASGAPVIAYGEGGAAESVIDGQTGILFRPGSGGSGFDRARVIEALIDAVQSVERGRATFREEDCRARAREFSKERFQRELVAAIRETWVSTGRDPAPLNERIRGSWSAQAASL